MRRILPTLRRLLPSGYKNNAFSLFMTTPRNYFQSDHLDEEKMPKAFRSKGKYGKSNSKKVMHNIFRKKIIVKEKPGNQGHNGTHLEILNIPTKLPFKPTMYDIEV